MTNGAFASSWPKKPITVVIMYGAGGGTDTITRVLVDDMAKTTGWNIKAINKPGAVGGVATKYVASQKADGYTILGAANYNKFVRVMGHMPADQMPWKPHLPTALAPVTESLLSLPIVSSGSPLRARKVMFGSPCTTPCLILRRAGRRESSEE